MNKTSLNNILNVNILIPLIFTESNSLDTFYACRQVFTCFKKPCSPVFLNNYKQNKTKTLLHTFLDIAKETACEKNQRKDTLPELVLTEVFISLNK